MGYHVRWRDQVDIVATSILQREHNPREAIGGCTQPDHALTDVVVPAVDAVEVAERKIVPEPRVPRSTTSSPW